MRKQDSSNLKYENEDMYSDFVKHKMFKNEYLSKLQQLKNSGKDFTIKTKQVLENMDRKDRFRMV